MKHILLLIMALNCAQTLGQDTEQALDAVAALQAQMHAGEWLDADWQAAALNLSAAEQLGLLNTAVRAHHSNAVRTLIDLGVDVNGRDGALQATPLMYAAYRNNVALCDVLLDAGADINAVDVNGDPAINWAVFAGHREVTRRLLDRGARADLVGHGAALDIAIRRGTHELAQMLCQAQNCRPTPTAVERAMLNALEEDQTKDFFSLVDRPEDALDRIGRPVIFRAAQLGQLEVIKWAIERGQSVDARDRIGFTPLMESARQAHRKAVEYLLGQGADVNAQAHANGLQFQAMHLAALSNDPDTLHLLLAAGGDVNARDSDGATPLLWAVGEDKSQAVQWLLANGADANLENRAGLSAAQLLAQSAEVNE